MEKTHTDGQRTVSFTRDEFRGLSASLGQWATIVFFGSGHVPLTQDEFVAGMMPHDRELAEATQRALSALAEVRRLLDVRQERGDAVAPPPLTINTTGHCL